MLEFHPTLAIAAHIPTALKHAYWVRGDLHKLFTTQVLLNHCDICTMSWICLPSFTKK